MTTSCCTRSRRRRTRCPLVLLHGYPSSAVEFLDVIGPLSDPTSHGGDRRDAFHVIVPFLPGFGLAPRVNGHGWTTAKLAAGLVEIMGRLGYSRYGVQGGDVGAGVAQDMAVADPDGVVGIHVVTDMLAAAAVRSFAGGRSIRGTSPSGTVPWWSG